MKIRPEEITAILEKEIQSFGVAVDVKETGTVLQVGDGIARVYGLDHVMSGEIQKVVMAWYLI
jgi:F-type H+-transporting ATPase subunit alpha